MFQDSSEDLPDGIVEVVPLFKSGYNSISIANGGILPRDASWSINQVLIKEVNQILKAKCPKSFFIYIGYESSWTFANGSLNLDLFFPDNVHLAEKENLKLPESIFSSIKNCNSVTCNKQKRFLISYKMAVSFKLNNFNFPPLSFSTVSKPVSSVPTLLSFAIAYSSSSDISALSHKSLSDPDQCLWGYCLFKYVYPSKSILPSKPVCLKSVRPSKPIISKNFYLSKPVCPRNINSSRSICSRNVCQSRSNVGPSKPVRPSKSVYKLACKPVCPSNVTPIKPVRPSNASLSKTACPGKVYSSKFACPSNICPSKPVCPINVCPSKHVCPSNVYSSKLFVLVMLVRVHPLVL